MEAECFVCKTKISTLPSTTRMVNIECPRCGKYEVSLSLQASRDDHPNAREAQVISGWIHEQNSIGLTPKLMTDNIFDLKKMRLPLFSERIDKILLFIHNEENFLGQKFNISNPKFIAASYSQNPDEMETIFGFLKERGFIEQWGGTSWYLTSQAYIAIDGLERPNENSTQAFVAMQFKGMDEIWEKGLSEAISDAGYIAHRVDKKEHLNKIDDEIMAEIRKSKFVVADLTGNNQGVYFEAGFAMGLGIQVVWTQQREVEEDKKKASAPHFDIRQYNCLRWDTTEDLRKNLAYRIENVFGKGPIKKVN